MTKNPDFVSMDPGGYYLAFKGNKSWRGATLKFGKFEGHFKCWDEGEGWIYRHSSDISKLNLNISMKKEMGGDKGQISGFFVCLFFC